MKLRVSALALALAWTGMAGAAEKRIGKLGLPDSGLSAWSVHSCVKPPSIRCVVPVLVRKVGSKCEIRAPQFIEIGDTDAGRARRIRWKLVNVGVGEFRFGDGQDSPQSFKDGIKFTNGSDEFEGDADESNVLAPDLSDDVGKRLKSRYETSLYLYEIRVAYKDSGVYKPCPGDAPGPGVINRD